MSEIYYILGIFIFISILYIEKYIDINKLKEYFDKLQAISEGASEEEVLIENEPQEKDELQNIQDLIEEYIIRNPDIFSRYNIKDE